MSIDQQRRHFKRIPFDANYHLSRDTTDWQGHVIDLSLKGALLSRPADLSANEGEAFRLTLLLSEDEVIIHMQVHIAHMHPDCLGVSCDFIDLESVTHLRRFLELNLGNAALLERELNEMLEFNKR